MLEYLRNDIMTRTQTQFEPSPETDVEFCLSLNKPHYTIKHDGRQINVQSSRLTLCLLRTTYWFHSGAITGLQLV